MIGKSYQVDLLSGLLRQAELRHRVISQNIANVNTPGYRNLDIKFAQSLDEMEQGQVPAGQDRVIETPGLAERQDGNNVNIEGELGKLTKNAMHFETYSHLLANKLSMFRSAITGQ